MTAIDTLTAQLGKLQREGDYAAKRGNLWLALEMADEARKVSAELEQLKQSAPTTTMEVPNDNQGNNSHLRR